jgi:DNA-binding response OmpR family regulator
MRVRVSLLLMTLPVTSLSSDSQTFRKDTLLLCVDDDLATLTLIKITLERQGFSVIAATHWRDAMDAFRNNPIDLVILDYEMPELKGDELAVLIRRDNSKVPLILHSGAPHIPEAAIRATDAFVEKGIDIQVLIAAVDKFIMVSRGNRTGRHGSK